MQLVRAVAYTGLLLSVVILAGCQRSGRYQVVAASGPGCSAYRIDTQTGATACLNSVVAWTVLPEEAPRVQEPLEAAPTPALDLRP